VVAPSTDGSRGNSEEGWAALVSELLSRTAVLLVASLNAMTVGVTKIVETLTEKTPVTTPGTGDETDLAVRNAQNEDEIAVTGLEVGLGAKGEETELTGTDVEAEIAILDVNDAGVENVSVTSVLAHATEAGVVDLVTVELSVVAAADLANVVALVSVASRKILMWFWSLRSGLEMVVNILMQMGKT